LIRADRSAAVLLLTTAALTGCGDSGPADTQVPVATPQQTTTSAAPLRAGTVVLESPADEADVKQCEIFRGRADLPADKTIIIGVRNKDNGSPERYFEAVTDWEYPEDLDTWSGAQWFGDKDSSAGQSFRVEVLIIDLKLAKKLSDQAKEKGWHSPDNPAGAQVAAHIDLHRVKGAGPADCS
jgi:predicted small lipoprotein YifL